ncbi:MAG TPA: pyrroloquinoline quinone-dependent dehydrogenase [Gemmatimonadaceae bacterium]|nr:pyrroloquinoline quinone-dependent dehydrogenase [Gemmatimonadaceae bacterium]
MSPRTLHIALLIAVTGCAAAASRTDDAAIPAGDWSAYGRDPGGARFSPLTEINKSNVSGLREVWRYRTGDVSDGTVYPRKSTFEATPILFAGTLYLSTPFNRVIALDPETGAERWSYDSKIDRTIRYSEAFASRGVSAWSNPSAQPNAVCARRIFLPTIDARLIALDAATGKPCQDFAAGGTIDLTLDVGPVAKGEYGVTSPPAVVSGVVIVGSSMGDNRGVDLERGTVRAFDARTGAKRWSWDPIPRRRGDPGSETWDSAAATRTRAANAWGVLSADPARDLVFIPTGSASPDYYGGLRPGKDLYANSVVALRASTGHFVWGFQVVHHDLWDYDVAASPALFTWRRDGKETPAVAIATKQGHLFVLDRLTGKPLLPVEERPVPASKVTGESAWPTQPFPVATPNLVGSTAMAADSAWGVSAEDRAACRAMMTGTRSEGIFTPPSYEGSVVYPGSVGGTNWGGASVDTDKGILVTSVNRLVQVVRVIPRDNLRAASDSGRRFGIDFASQRGTPYGMSRRFLLSPKGVPCNSPPWGELVAVDLSSGAIRWKVPLGMIPSLAAVSGSDKWGSISLGGPITTTGGIIFVGGTMDDYIRAFDTQTGAELWKGKLPAGGQATPMTYRSPASGRQIVVIAAGGHGGLGTTLGDYVVAFALR